MVKNDRTMADGMVSDVNEEKQPAIQSSGGRTFQMDGAGSVNEFSRCEPCGWWESGGQ